MSLTIEVTGVDKLVECLNQMQDLKEPVAEAMELYLEKVITDAKSIVPVRTGTLQRSIMFSGGDGEYQVGSRVFYAPFVEYGTFRMRPQPFLGPALLWNISALKDALLDIVGNWLRRHGE
jgi:HK97 gp10 family phage protein